MRDCFSTHVELRDFQEKRNIPRNFSGIIDVQNPLIFFDNNNNNINNHNTLKLVLYDLQVK